MVNAVSHVTFDHLATSQKAVVLGLGAGILAVASIPFAYLGTEAFHQLDYKQAIAVTVVHSVDVLATSFVCDEINRRVSPSSWAQTALKIAAGVGMTLLAFPATNCFSPIPFTLQESLSLTLLTGGVALASSLWGKL